MSYTFLFVNRFCVFNASQDFFLFYTSEAFNSILYNYMVYLLKSSILPVRIHRSGTLEYLKFYLKYIYIVKQP